MNDSSRQPSWNAVFDIVLRQHSLGLHTAMVGAIRSYSEAEQTAEVTLAVQFESADGVFEELPPLADLPVVWPGAWSAGDSCLVVFCEESFAKWFATGSVEQPEVLRRHGLHGVCIPLVARAGQAVEFVALANLVNERLDAIQQAFDAHTHAVTTTGTSTAQAGTAAAVTSPIGPLASVAAEKVKAR